MPHRKKNNYFFRNNGDLTFEKMNGVWVEIFNMFQWCGIC